MIGADVSMAPMTPLLEQWYEYGTVSEYNGGDPFMGRHHRGSLDAGFTRPEASVSVASWTAGTQEATRRCASFLKAQLHGFPQTALAEGWMDRTRIEAVSAEIDAWGDRRALRGDDVRGDWLGQ